MQLAFCNELFEIWNTDAGFDFARCCRFLASCGYEGLEVAPFTIASDAFLITSKRRQEIRKTIEAEGMRMIALHWLLAKTEGLYLTSPDAIVRQRTTEYLIELTRLCSDLGGEFMVFGSPAQRNLLPGVSYEQAEAYAVEVFQGILPELKKRKVRIALEPLSPKETDFLTTAASAVRLSEKIGAPELIALHLDCKAMSSEALPMTELIKKYKKQMIYFHLNDPNLKCPGFGDLEFEPILQALADVNYQGWLSMEPFDASPGLEKMAKESFQYIQKRMNRVTEKKA